MSFAGEYVPVWFLSEISKIRRSASSRMTLISEPSSCAWEMISWETRARVRRMLLAWTIRA